MPLSPQNNKRKRGGRGRGGTAKKPTATACSQCSNCTGGKKAPRRNKSNVAATVTTAAVSIDLSTLSPVVRRSIEKVQQLEAYNATAKHPDTGEIYFLHRDFINDCIHVMAQLNGKTIAFVLNCQKCSTRDSVHSVCGKGSFSSREAMDKCPSAVAFGAISDIVSRMTEGINNVDYGNHCALFGYNSRTVCQLQEGTRYCKHWTMKEAAERVPVILEIAFLCDHFKIPCLHTNFCGDHQASNEPMKIINAYKSPYFIVSKSSTHLATLTTSYPVFKGKRNQLNNVTRKVMEMDEAVTQFETLVHERLLALGYTSELPTKSFSQCLMDNPKIKYVVSDVKETLRAEIAAKAAVEAEKKRRRVEREKKAVVKAAEEAEKKIEREKKAAVKAAEEAEKKRRQIEREKKAAVKAAEKAAEVAKNEQRRAAKKALFDKMKASIKALPPPIL